MEGSKSSRSNPLRKAARTPGRREANKLDKLDRIKRAARELFTTAGYDEATTRQIAKKAGVALGTVFTYASTKRDLLFLVSNDLLDEGRHLAEASFQRNRSLQHNFIAFCAVFYRVLQAQPDLSKLVFRELLFYDSGIHSVRALANRTRTLKSIEALVVNARERAKSAFPNRRISSPGCCSASFRPRTAAGSGSSAATLRKGCPISGPRSPWSSMDSRSGRRRRSRRARSSAISSRRGRFRGVFRTRSIFY